MVRNIITILNSFNDFSHNPSKIVIRVMEQCASCTYKFDKIKLSLITYLCNTIKIYPFKGIIHTMDLRIHKLQNNATFN